MTFSSIVICCFYPRINGNGRNPHHIAHYPARNQNRCGPCRMIAPHFESMSAEYASNAIFVKVDVDAMDKLAQKCGIRAMPTFQFYKNGEKVDEFSGADIATLKEKVSALV